MTRKSAALTALQERIGHRFGNAKLLDQALTHSSAVAGANKASSYQRLEFLGDRVLGLAVADMLLRQFPDATEGELSRRLAVLVRAETCAAVARAVGLDAAVQLGKGSRSRARLTTTILGDVCEAVIGAVYVDADYPAAAAMVGRLWQEHMLAPPRPLRDPKTVLQEWAQGRGLPTPIYVEIGRSGPHHDPEFRIAVELPELPAAEGVGRSKRAAEQAAAAAMLTREGVAMDDSDG
jgi:ribonuclease III